MAPIRSESGNFSLRFRATEPPFVYLELGQAQLMLEQAHAEGWQVAPLERPLGRGVNFPIEVSDAQAVWAALQSQGYEPFRGMKDSWYPVSPTAQEGQREFLTQDPDGYLMRSAQPLGRRHAG